MIKFIKILAKKSLFYISQFLFVFKCRFFYLIHGGEGLSYCLKHLPKNYIILILKKYGVNIGEGSDIETGFTLHRLRNRESLKNLEIGKRVYIGHNFIVDLTSQVIINDDCAFGSNCQIWTHTGNWTLDRSDEKDNVGSVRIGKSVICYSGSIIGQNVYVGDYARVAANSVVTRNVEEKSLVGGVPANVIRLIREDIKGWSNE